VEPVFHIVVLEAAFAGLVAHGQSRGWSNKRNSSAERRACSALGETVWTTMPSVTGVVQPVTRARPRGPSTSTMQVRQLPSTFR
jgi:hypothetical protein